MYDKRLEADWRLENGDVKNEDDLASVNNIKESGTEKYKEKMKKWEGDNKERKTGHEKHYLLQKYANHEFQREPFTE